MKCVINRDAHRFEHAGFLRLGAGIARKGWLTKEDVVNTLAAEGTPERAGPQTGQSALRPKRRGSELLTRCLGLGRRGI